MPVAQEQFVVDGEGRRTAVLIDIERYRQLLEAEEEFVSVKVFDEAKATDDEAIPFSQAVAEIEAALK